MNPEQAYWYHKGYDDAMMEKERDCETLFPETESPLERIYFKDNIEALKN